MNPLSDLVLNQPLVGANDTLHVFFGCFAVLFALLIGSFLNVVISRLPEDRSVVHPPSACPSCGAPIRPYDNIPVVSWLILRGKCRDCGTPISSLYPTIELLTGLLGLALYLRIVPGPASLTPAHAMAFAVYLGFVAMLVAITYIDLRHYIIPDELSIYAVPVVVAAMALLEWAGWPEAIGWKRACVGATAGGLSLTAVMGTYWLIRRRQGMGWGDPKMLAMIGAFTGALPALPIVLLVSTVAGSIVGVAVIVLGRRKGAGAFTALPFGPFLALGAIVYLLHGKSLGRSWFVDPALIFGF